MSFPRLFHREPVTRKGIRERSAVVRSAELALPTFPAPVSREAARAALNHREFSLASEMIILGAKFAPAEPEFPYLMRLVQNEKDLQPQRLVSTVSE